MQETTPRVQTHAAAKACGVFIGKQPPDAQGAARSLASTVPKLLSHNRKPTRTFQAVVARLNTEQAKFAPSHATQPPTKRKSGGRALNQASASFSLLPAARHALSWKSCSRNTDGWLSSGIKHALSFCDTSMPVKVTTTHAVACKSIVVTAPMKPVPTCVASQISTSWKIACGKLAFFFFAERAAPRNYKS